jgi:hypothetical protein
LFFDFLDKSPIWGHFPQGENYTRRLYQKILKSQGFALNLAFFALNLQKKAVFSFKIGLTTASDRAASIGALRQFSTILLYISHVQAVCAAERGAIRPTARRRTRSEKMLFGACFQNFFQKLSPCALTPLVNCAKMCYNDKKQWKTVPKKG